MKVIISYYLKKNSYFFGHLTSENVNNSIFFDESLFSHENTQQILFVRLINNRTRVIRLDILPDRKSDNIKSIIKIFVAKENTIIITDGAAF